jgi:hypothetical protein
MYILERKKQDKQGQRERERERGREGGMKCREREKGREGGGRRGDKDLKRSHFSHTLKFKYMHRIMVCGRVSYVSSNF